VSCGGSAVKTQRSDSSMFHAGWGSNLPVIMSSALVPAGRARRRPG
jgi:hypothetical protein